MKQLQALLLAPEDKEFPTMEAEDLAARFLESGSSPSNDVVSRSELPGVWHFASSSKRVVALFREENLLSQMQAFIGGLGSPAAVSVALLPPGVESGDAFHSLSTGRHLPGWQLALSLNDQEPLDTAADEQAAAYLWTGILLIAVMSGLALVVAGAIRRQMQLARAKN
ncbi:MAG: hypothetical protein GY953_17620, partial [bacterium]|nr:hypothetical protein [bacterium]